MTTDKWDGLLAEGTPQAPEPRHNARQERRRPAAQYNWGRILLAIATIALTVGLIIWNTIRTTSGPEDPQPGPQTTPAATAGPTWSHIEDTQEDPEIRDEASSTVTDFITAFCQREKAGDWWDTDAAIAGLASDELRYEFTEYPELAGDGVTSGETVTNVEFSGVDDTPLGYWAGTAAITMDTGRTISAEITAEATTDGWRVTSWQVVTS